MIIQYSLLFCCEQSAVTVDSSIQELQELMHDLPDYADQFLNMICNVLRDYRDKCNSAYRGKDLSERRLDTCADF